MQPLTPQQRKQVEDNINLVHWTIRRYYSWILDNKDKADMAYEDMVQEGTLGLITAVQRHDPEKGKLSTYAPNWIRQALQRAMNNTGNTIRIPVHAREERDRIHRARIALIQALGRDVTDEEVAEEIGYTVEKYRHNYNLPRVRQSLDTHLTGDASEDYVSELKVGASQHRTEEQAFPFSDHFLEEVHASLSSLRSREREMVEQYFGLFGRPKLTLGAIADAHGVSRERVRQIVKGALIFLKHSERLRDLVEDIEYEHDLQHDRDMMHRGSLY